MLIALTLALAGCSPASTLDEQEVYVEGNRAPGVVYEGEDFARVRTWIEGQGVGRVAWAKDQLLEGDFRIEARLTMVELAWTAAALQLGQSYFGFDGKDKTLFLNGPLFGGGVSFLGSAETFITPGKPFELVAERTGRSLRISIDGALAHEHEVGAQALGRFGFRPHRATLRIHRFAASGAIGTPPPRDPRELLKLQPAIDQAIDEGVAYLLRTQHRDGSWSCDAGKFFGGQTALCAYTLLKCGLSAEHPAVRQALAYLEQMVPHETYSVAFTLLALEATGDPRHLPRIEELRDALVEWQEAGSWGYPFDYTNGWTENVGRNDLSNAQLAALGLRAAEQAGAEVPRKTWKSLIESTLGYRTPEERILTAADVGTTRTTAIAGFGYKGPDKPYGSMTAAGIAVLEIGREALGKALKGKTARHTDHAIRSGLAWLAHNWTTETNPGADKWLYYYLYGLERIGALLEIERIGAHPWYLEGAESILKRRDADGSWSQRVREPDTCFALLFLKRATAPSSGARPLKARVRELEQPSAEVHLRATGENPLTVWVTGFGQRVLEEFAVQGRGPRIVAVEYLRDGELLERIEANPRRAWDGERHAAQLTFDRRGTFEIEVRVLVLPADADPALPGEPVALLADPFTVEVPYAWEAGMDAAAALRGANLLTGAQVSARASSRWADTWAPELACDGLESTAWLCAADDRAPFLELDLGRGQRAQVIVVGSIGSSRERAREFDRLRSVEVLVNGKDRYPLTFDADPRRAARLVLPKRIRVRTLRIEELVREPGSKYHGGCGLSEVALLANP